MRTCCACLHWMPAGWSRCKPAAWPGGCRGLAVAAPPFASTAALLRRGLWPKERDWYVVLVVRQVFFWAGIYKHRLAARRGRSRHPVAACVPEGVAALCRVRRAGRAGCCMPISIATGGKSVERCGGITSARSVSHPWSCPGSAACLFPWACKSGWCVPILAAGTGEPCGIVAGCGL